MFNIGAGGVLVNIFFKFLYFNCKEMDRKCSQKALFTYFYPMAIVMVSSYFSEEPRVDMIAGKILINKAYVIAFI